MRLELRVDKPFALMMPDIETVEQHCFVSDAERKLLQSTARPIALLKKKPASTVVEEVSSIELRRHLLPSPFISPARLVMWHN